MIIPVQDTDQFFQFIEDTIKIGDYRYKYLNQALAGIYNREVEIGANSYIHQDDGGWVIFIEFAADLLIYGAGYSDVHLARLTRGMDPPRYKGFNTMGTYDLIYTVLERAKIENYKLIKDRCFYTLTDIAIDSPRNNLKLARSGDRTQLVGIFQQYYVEEYQGERNKPAEFLLPMINRLIQEKKIYTIKFDTIIAAFCSIIDPDIGVLFTRGSHRGQGLGLRLLAHCSRMLLEKNGFAYVMTDMHKPASNIICRKIGYELIYEHTNVIL
jgi:GNAT superfamily N-acetyltransferase